MKLLTHYLISSLKVGYLNNHASIIIQYSKKSIILLNFLQQYKLIRRFKILSGSKILVFLEPHNGSRVIELDVPSVVSRPFFISVFELQKFNQDKYFGLITTTSGIITFQEALYQSIGGEVLVCSKHIR